MYYAVAYDDREDDQVDHRVEDQDAAEDQDQHADGVLARWQFQPRATVSRLCLVRRYPSRLLPPSRLSSLTGILDGIMDRPGAQPEFD
jgi:hypothetical protein